MGDRALAHIERIAWIRPIEGADNIECIGVLGWTLIAKKGEFQVGDLTAFFEIDSHLPEAEWSEFLRPKKFNIKTYKLGKFGVISQGLALPISSIPELKEKHLEVGQDITSLLKVTYAVAEDNDRKADIDAALAALIQKKAKIKNSRFIQWLMKREWGRKILTRLFHQDLSSAFPTWIKKTDESRIENCPFYLGSPDNWIFTEKIDGQSGTYALDLTKKKKSQQYLICSRNRNLSLSEPSNYLVISQKYDIEQVLRAIARNRKAKRVVLQGEVYGPGIQGNPYKLKALDFAAFNLIIDGHRLMSLEARDALTQDIINTEKNIPWVPILNIGEIPHTMEEMKAQAEGKSVINDKVDREGIVYRSVKGDMSFKNVSRTYLLKHSS